MKSPRHPLLAASMLVAALALATAAPASAQTQVASAASVSTAETAKAYKVDAAKHVYKAYANQIYKGKLPPLVHAIVVLEVELDQNGAVRDVMMIRVPTHAPDVTARVKAMIHSVSPMPAPQRMGGVKFTEVWLVDKSGKFQLDTLTEGQL
jgi:periplasmic protein TonB